ncbi:hypothetical protein [Candidatus Schmidhempelia bombi]|uniref:Bacteriocin n=1 Tax=Candidatus Schmidhempelia bombi str. Bimp TaxID=1387197 RepID=A0AB94IBV3_9GAMM|nr:hypothetical protein [Candidatus Schmidhempelia bombi]TEA26887.1 hypothetical protein O970_06415 [Candidatus Schmidhempelia bombi str. Bimp]
MKQLDKKQMKSVAGSGFDSYFPTFPEQFFPMDSWSNSNQWSSQNMVTNGFNNNGISNGNDNNVISNGSSSNNWVNYYN